MGCVVFRGVRLSRAHEGDSAKQGVREDPNLLFLYHSKIVLAKLDSYWDWWATTTDSITSNRCQYFQAMVKELVAVIYVGSARGATAHRETRD
jgi:hypothetical protein